MPLSQNSILVDGRWQGAHGIGRFSTEVLKRLNGVDILLEGPAPLSLKNLYWQSRLLSKPSSYKAFFTPGFNPSLRAQLPVIFTLHDLIHLHATDKHKWLYKFYYELFIKPAARKAYKILTVSNYSKIKILEWLSVPEEKVVVVGNGVSELFQPEGERYQPGFPYLLHVGNTKAHKNMTRLLQAFAIAKIDEQIKLICTGQLTEAHLQLIARCGLEGRVIMQRNLSEQQLANYYRGAIGVVFPSLHEGFGLPVLEGMASGVPVLTSTTTSMPEVAGEAAILVDPYSIESLANGIEALTENEDMRLSAIQKGIRQARGFSWDGVAMNVQRILDELK